MASKESAAVDPQERPTIARKRLPEITIKEEEEVQQPQPLLSTKSKKWIPDEEEEDDSEEEQPQPLSKKRPLESDSDSSSEEEDSSDSSSKHHHRPHKRSRSPVAALSKSQFSEDIKLVAPMPLVHFLQQRRTRKACGRCEECKKPPCGVCKQCLQNQKHPKPNGGNRDRRRCEMLKCKYDRSEPEIVVIPGIPTDKEEISKMLQKISSQVAEKSAMRGSPDFDIKEYEALCEKIHQLHNALAAIKSRKTRQKTKFPKCFYDAFGVVSELEKKRLKFAKFVVRAGSGEDCRTLADKREMRDELDEMITTWCTARAKNLAPVMETETYFKLLSAKRTQ